jgi:glucan phosphoethanolaminetransferase (alkaline phosphatase superfamily)
MNAIRAKIICSWLLFLAWAVSNYLHLHFIALCALILVLFVRNTKPKLPQPPQRIGYILGFGLVAFLVLVLIDAYYPFPARLQNGGRILAGLILGSLLCYGVYLDYKAFKKNASPA